MLNGDQQSLQGFAQSSVYLSFIRVLPDTYTCAIKVTNTATRALGNTRGSSRLIVSTKKEDDFHTSTPTYHD